MPCPEADNAHVPIRQAAVNDEVFDAGAALVEDRTKLLRFSLNSKKIYVAGKMTELCAQI